MSRAVIITSYLEYPVDLPALLRPDDFIVCLDGGYDIIQRLAITPDLLLGDFDSTRMMIPDDIKILRYPPEKNYTDLELAFRILDPEKTPDLLVIGGLGGRLDQTLVNVQMLMRYTASPAEASAAFASDRKSQAASGAFGNALGDTPDDASDAPEAAADEPDYGTLKKYRQILLLDGHHRCFVVHGNGELPSEEADPDPIRASAEAGFTVGGPVGYTIPRIRDSYLSILPLTEECSGVYLDGVKYPLANALLRRGESRTVSNEFLTEQAHLRLRRGSLLVVIAKRDHANI